MTRRRVFTASVVGAVRCAPFGALAQAQKVYRIGVLAHFIPRVGISGVIAALRELGYEEGRNVEFDYRYAQAEEELLAGLAGDLVAAKPDLILALLNPEILAAKRATSTIPIVMAFALTPVESGLIASLARPGENITGTTVEDPDLAGKKMEILRDTVPRLARFSCARRR